MSTTRTPLARAIFDSGRKQIEIATETHIHESRLSKLVNGHFTPTKAEKRALAKALGVPAAALFPSVVALAS